MPTRSLVACVLAIFTSTAVVTAEDESRTDAVQRVLRLPPGPGNPRNSEGDFVQLKDGSLLFVYTHFTGGAGDHASAHLAGRRSDDGGRTWSDEDTLVLANDAKANVMSVSLLRLADGRIALFCLRKNSLSDCRPVVRFSTDEAKTWGEPVEVVPEGEIGYYVLNNDRVVQTTSGRLVVPVAQHHGPDWEKWTPRGRIYCYFSDDAGRTWRRGEEMPAAETSDGKPVTLQEPGVVELRDGRLLAFCRTDAGSQYVAHSRDRGTTWSRPQASNIVSPQSPASIERVPATDDLLLVWNDHRDTPPKLKGKRTPLCVAVSRDDGQTWEDVKTLAVNPDGWYCYTAVEFIGEHVLLGHCGGDRRENNGLAETHVTRFPLDWLRR
jgi:hypothetical protein